MLSPTVAHAVGKSHFDEGPKGEGTAGTWEQQERIEPSLAWVYKSSVGLQHWRGSTSQAWAYKSSLGLQV